MNLLFQPIHTTRYPVLHQFFAEVQKVSEFTASQAKICLNLFLMRRGSALDRFQLNDHFAFDKNIGSESFVKFHTSKFYGDGYLTFNSQTLLSQDMHQGDLINAFQQTRSEFPMDCYRSLDYDRPDLIFRHPRFPLRLSASARDKVLTLQGGCIIALLCVSAPLHENYLA